MLKVGVVGYGYWGPNLVRNFMESDAARVSWVSDLSEKRLEQVARRYPGVRTTRSVEELLSAADVDAVAIATPVSTHFDLAMRALRAGKHVLVEKPLSDSSENCLRMIDEAEKRGLTLMVDHTFPYTGAVRKIGELVQSGQIGEVFYYDSVRINLGLFQHDVNVIWDLAVHDLSIIDYLFADKPVAVSATGMSHVDGQPENVAYLTLFFEGKMVAHFHVNWLAPVKIRRTLIGGSKKMIVYDDLEPSEKVKVYDKGITLTEPDGVYKMLVGYRAGDMWAPQLDTFEALKAVTEHFVKCVESGTRPLTDGRAGLDVVRILEAAPRSMVERGRPMDVV